jgi:hypothetical protein
LKKSQSQSNEFKLTHCNLEAQQFFQQNPTNAMAGNHSKHKALKQNHNDMYVSKLFHKQKKKKKGNKN